MDTQRRQKDINNMITSERDEVVFGVKRTAMAQAWIEFYTESNEAINTTFKSPQAHLPSTLGHLLPAILIVHY